jgi:hypothetical protein
MTDDEIDQCDELCCTEDADFVFTDSLGVETPVCEDHAVAFPDEMLAQHGARMEEIDA